MAVALSQAISFSLSFSRLEKLLQCLSASLCSSPQHPTEPPRASLQSVPSLWSCAHQSVSAAWHSKEEPLSWGLMAAPVPVQPLLQLTFAMASLPHRLLLHLLSVHQGAQVLSCQPVFYPANAHLLPCVVWFYASSRAFPVLSFTVPKGRPVSAACQGPSAQPCCPDWLGLRTLGGLRTGLSQEQWSQRQHGSFSVAFDLSGRSRPGSGLFLSFPSAAELLAGGHSITDAQNVWGWKGPLEIIWSNALTCSSRATCSRLATALSRWLWSVSNMGDSGLGEQEMGFEGLPASCAIAWSPLQ